MNDRNKGLIGLLGSVIFSALILVMIISNEHLDSFINALAGSDVTGFFVFVGLVLGLGANRFINRQFKAMVFLGGLLMALGQLISGFSTQMAGLADNSLIAWQMLSAVFFIMGLCLLSSFSVWAMRRHILDAGGQD